MGLASACQSYTITRLVSLKTRVVNASLIRMMAKYQGTLEQNLPRCR